MILYCAALSYSGSNNKAEIRDKILSLALEEKSEMLNAIEETDKLGLRDDELISLYMELLDYYTGEGPGEILSEKITSMGDKIFPFLIEKKNMPLKCLEKYERLCAYKDVKERNIKIANMIDAIKKGIVLYAEYPENLKIEAEEDLKIIGIFLEDYRKNKRKLPKNLHILRMYVCKEYGYKLKTFNPWGYPFNYSPQKGNKYILGVGKIN